MEKRDSSHRKPNVIWIFGDQHRPQDIRADAGHDSRVPHIAHVGPGIVGARLVGLDGRSRLQSDVFGLRSDLPDWISPNLFRVKP